MLPDNSKIQVFLSPYPTPDTESPSKAIADFGEKSNLLWTNVMARPWKFVAFQGKNDK